MPEAKGTDSQDSAKLGPRLEQLRTDLDRFPAGLSCPWALARVFNECLAQAKRSSPDDSVLQSMGSLRQNTSDAQEGSSNALVGTVQALVGQILIAVESGRPAASKSSSPTVAKRKKASG